LRIDEAKSLIKTLKENEIEIISFLYNINRANTNIILGKENVFVHGKENISDKLFDLTFEISPQSFYQVNHDQTEKLYAKIIELAEFTGNETVLDLYCGIGTIALSIADKVKEVYGVELVKEAIVNAEKNAKLNNITNVKFNTGDADEAGDWLKSLEVVPDVIIVDPPRKGLSNSALLDIMAMDPAKIIYVSCDPATLARDAKILTQSGYTISTIQPLDLFPRTPHVETVILLANN
jgi:23S rRNA (uracil1939-C5)-methyltransferase